MSDVGRNLSLRHRGRPPGWTMPPDMRARISAGVRRAIAEGRGHVGRRPNNVYAPPAEFADMYADFAEQYGYVEARRLVEDHARVVARRRARS